ncbi:MAG: sugar transferase [Erythrobacter sp.]
MHYKQIAKPTYVPPQVLQRGVFVAANPFSVRAMDVLGAIILIVLFAPVMVVITLSIFIANPGPILFRQQRIGRNGQTFNCLKFRTMATDAEARLEHLLASDPEARAQWRQDHKLRDDPRIVGIGSFLRKSSLDELPQLFNVLAGEMSLVGPRPIVAAEIDKYGRYFEHYCRVRPGMTGLWQISGRNNVSYRKRVAFDVVYVKRGQIGHNIQILLLTLPRVLSAKGSY